MSNHLNIVGQDDVTLRVYALLEILTLNWNRFLLLFCGHKIRSHCNDIGQTGLIRLAWCNGKLFHYMIWWPTSSKSNPVCIFCDDVCEGRLSCIMVSGPLYEWALSCVDTAKMWSEWNKIKTIVERNHLCNNDTIFRKYIIRILDLFSLAVWNHIRCPVISILLHLYEYQGLVQVKAWCLFPPSHYLHQCWIFVIRTLRRNITWHLMQNKLHSRKWMWKYCLQYDSHFCKT